MAASFAAYASQYLNRQQQGASTVSSSSHQPLFFSFTTDQGSHADDTLRDREGELDDDGDPHLRHSSDILTRRVDRIDDENPYLRLDEEEHPTVGSSRRALDSLLLIASERDSSIAEPVQGWLAHQSPMSFRDLSPSPTRTSSDSVARLSDVENSNITPSLQPPPPTRTTLSLTESLLPRNGQVRPVDVFHLPDPRRLSRGRRILNDSVWTAVWCFSLSACLFGAVLVLLITSKPAVPRGSTLPYTTLLHTIPLLTILTLLSALVSYAHILLLRTFVRPIIFATSVFVPATLFISAIWAFVGSFMWDEGVEPTWGETVGLRLFSLIPLILALLTTRRLLNLPRDIRTTSSILNLTIQLLIVNPFLLALSPLILLISLIASVPFLTLAFRLLLIGYVTYPSVTSNTWEWHVYNWAGWAICGTLVVWLWSWGVARGVLRSTAAAVVGAWYFHPPHTPVPRPTSTLRLHAALFRATTTSLGTICLSALFLTGIRLLALFTSFLRRAPLPILPWLSVPLSILGNLTGSLSPYALVYTGLTGDAFYPSAQRARALTAAMGSGKSRFRQSGGDPSLGLLTMTPLTLTLPFALSTYLFVAHTLMAPDYAPMAALLAGGATALVGMFCVGLVVDAADALYICYCIDRDVGAMHREEVFNAFEGRPRPERQPSPSIVASPLSSETEPEPDLHRTSIPGPHAEATDDPEEEDSLILPGPDFP